jgi:hypothetical protein
MKAIGTNPKKEKTFPMGAIVKLSPKLRAALAEKEPGKPTPEYAVVQEAELISEPGNFGCGVCCLKPFNRKFNPGSLIDCSTVVDCRRGVRQDEKEVQFVPCKKTGETE